MADRTLLEEIQRVKALGKERDGHSATLEPWAYEEASDAYDAALRNLFAERGAEIEAAVRDAERYQWLRANQGRIAVFGEGPRLVEIKELDAAIYSAREKGSHE